MSDDILTYKEKIERRIKSLEAGRLKIMELAREKAEKHSRYEMNLAITILKIKNGVITEFEGAEIKGLAANLIEKVAKGICWEHSMASDAAETSYKAGIEAMKSIQAELNGYQSILKYLES
jgi:hypothetical protein